MKRFTYALAVAALSGVAVVGCEREDTTTATNTGTRTTSTAPAVDVDVNTDKLKDMANRTGDAVQRGAEATADVAREAGRDAKDALGAAGRKVDNAVDVDVNRTGDASQAGARGTAAAPDAEGIRDVLGQVAEASLTKGGLDDLAERLVDQDRNRLGQGLQGDYPELDTFVEQFRNDWKAKYNSDFDISNEARAFPATTFQITQGELGRNAAGSELNVDVDRNAAGGQTATVDVDRKSGVDSPDSGAADANRNDPGRNIASVRIAASHGMPALTVPMIHEAPDVWRIDVPNTLTADKLRSNVLSHLRAAHQNKDQWPADVNQAQALVAHHVLMALMDQPAQQR